MSVSDDEIPPVAVSSPPIEVEQPSKPNPPEKKIPDKIKVVLVFHTNYLKTIPGILNLLQSVYKYIFIIPIT